MRLRILFTTHQCTEESSREGSEAFRVLTEMDGGKRKRSVCATQEPEAQQKMVKDKNIKAIPEVVTLKKEIGLLSACTIIIGKIVTGLSHYAILLNDIQAKVTILIKLILLHVSVLGIFLITSGTTVRKNS